MAASVNAFLNICRHRGNRLCRADFGNAATITCAYHGWTYANNGKLVAVPNLQDAYFGELDLDQWNLVPVAQLDSYKGLIFATFDPECAAPDANTWEKWPGTWTASSTVGKAARR